MDDWKKILAIIIIVVAILAIIIFNPGRDTGNRSRNDDCCQKNDRHRNKRLRPASTSTCYNSFGENVRMKLSATKKLATFSISLGRPDVESAYIMHGGEILADITKDFVQNSGVANGFWRLDEHQADLLQKGSINIKVTFSDDDTVIMRVE